jgi:hypothetical protein
MNVEFRELFGVEIALIPLRETGNIVCGNATRMNWNDACPKTKGDELYVLGNPPYAGSSMQSAQQKQDFVDFFGTTRYPRNLDYISLWLMKAARYVADGTGNVGFVSTNSVSQGDHVGLMWPTILDTGVEVSFAHESFRWSNQAKGNAGVTCVVIGLSAHPPKLRGLYADGQKRLVANINPYLKASGRNTIVLPARDSLFGLPEMVRGSQPTDGGNLILAPAEADDLKHQYPEAARFIKGYMGASEFLNGNPRCCLWIRDEDAAAAAAVPPIKQRLEKVTTFRLAGSTTAQAMANKPYRFMQRPYKDTACILVPLHSSEARDYIPIGFIAADTVVSNACSVMYDAEPWVFALVSSTMHLAWVRVVGGGLETRLRYSVGLCYNTVPVPQLSDADRALLADRAFGVLEARERHTQLTLAQMYEPGGMPDDLRVAHRSLDAAVDRLYRRQPFASDDDRSELLFDMYEAAIARSEGSREVAVAVDA